MPALNPPILSVAELTRQLKDLVEANFAHVWVLGEVSNCTRAGSGHVYFTLKDGDAQIRAVAWRSQTARWKFEIHDGLEVVVAGPIEIYPARGSYQLIVEQLIPQGVGALELAFRQLQAKLEAEGLFDPRRKRPLPAFPRRIAIITSPTGAAVRDILQVLTRRWAQSTSSFCPSKCRETEPRGKLPQHCRTCTAFPASTSSSPAAAAAAWKTCGPSTKKLSHGR